VLYAVNFEWVFHLLLSISNVMQTRLIRRMASIDILSFPRLTEWTKCPNLCESQEGAMYDVIQYTLIVAALASGLIMLVVGVLSAIDHLLDICGNGDDDAED